MLRSGTGCHSRLSTSNHDEQTEKGSQTQQTMMKMQGDYQNSNGEQWCKIMDCKSSCYTGMLKTIQNPFRVNDSHSGEY